MTSDVTPTRSVALEMKDERRAMQEGYVFLDEKCLLLASEILRELTRYTTLRREVAGAHVKAMVALERAVMRHGLEDLQIYPADVQDDDEPLIARTRRAVMGVRLQDVAWRGIAPPVERAIDPSEEAEACRSAFRAVVAGATVLAGVVGNLERLRVEYRRALRRARALHDVLLPELDRDVQDIELRLEELEQEDAVAMRSHC